MAGYSKWPTANSYSGNRTIASTLQRLVLDALRARCFTLRLDSAGREGFQNGRLVRGTYLLSGSSKISLTMASVVSSNPAIEAAFCSAVRVTLVGSITPLATRSS